LGKKGGRGNRDVYSCLIKSESWGKKKSLLRGRKTFRKRVGWWREGPTTRKG